MPVQNKPHHPQFSLLVLGLAASYVAVRLIANQLWGILQYGLLALAVVVLTMFLVGLTACWRGHRPLAGERSDRMDRTLRCLCSLSFTASLSDAAPSLERRSVK